MQKKKKFEAQKNKYAFWYIFRGFNFFFFFFFFFETLKIGMNPEIYRFI